MKQRSPLVAMKIAVVMLATLASLAARPLRAQATTTARDTVALIAGDSASIRAGIRMQADTALRRSLAVLRTVTPVRVQTTRVILGDYREVRSDSVRLTDRNGSYVIALADIQTVAVQRSKIAKGAGIGAIGAALLVGGAAALLGSAFCDGGSSCDGDVIGIAIYGAAIGAVPGALIGAGIGSFVHGWKTVFAR